MKSNHLVTLIIFLVFWIHGGTVGISDDEAYYWVLAQQPRWGFAYHPPGVIWMISLSQALLGFFFEANSTWVTRLPAAGGAAFLVHFLQLWWRDFGVDDSKVRWSVLGLLAVAGWTVGTWMTVPDIPLFMGMGLLMWASHRWVIEPRSSGAALGLVFGALLSCFGKFSGVLPVGSAALFILFSTHLKGTAWIKAWVILSAGTALGFVPALIWNSQHEWAAFLYQASGRHQGEISWVRLGRFWLVQVLIAGPALIGILALFLKAQTLAAVRDVIGLFRRVGTESGSGAELASRQVFWFSIFPFLIFFSQPLFSDFKVHWGLSVWVPIYAWFALRFAGSSSRWWKFHLWFGLLLAALVMLAVRIPLITHVQSLWGEPNPKIDVTNDLRGWDRLEEFLWLRVGEPDSKLPILASRYQTAAQAAFALNDVSRVAYVPRPTREKDEWPDLGVTHAHGPGWPTLTAPVLYVADHRYNEPPKYRKAQCQDLGKLNAYSGDVVMKWVQVWKCSPILNEGSRRESSPPSVPGSDTPPKE